MHENTSNASPRVPARWHEFAVGLLRTGGVLGGFVAFGLAAALVMAPETVEPSPGAAGPAYPGRVPDAAPTDRGPLWLIDGYNVICANLLGGRDRSGWWREEYRIALLDRLEQFADPAAELWVVFDGSSSEPPSPAAEARRTRAVYAPSADEWLVARVKADAETRPVAVVTSDRKVADRARHRGAEIVDPRALLERCTG